MAKYYAYTDGKKMVKVGCRHRGEMFYGVAKCDDADTFDYDTGYRLAKARCDYKIAQVRHDEAKFKNLLAMAILEHAKENVEISTAKYGDACNYLDDMAKNLSLIEKHLT